MPGGNVPDTTKYTSLLRSCIQMGMPLSSSMVMRSLSATSTDSPVCLVLEIAVMARPVPYRCVSRKTLMSRHMPGFLLSRGPEAPCASA